MSTIKPGPFLSLRTRRRPYSRKSTLKDRTFVGSVALSESWWVIDIGGNNLRMMFFAYFERGKVFVKHITTHTEYDRLTRYYRENKE
ncbi:type II toxin-antitoxin system HigB family toxin [Salmonella enterica]|nr:type II toxin-antitoxin system HigB family toxin [Salmonella enterica]